MTNNDERRKYNRISKEVNTYFEVVESPDDFDTAGRMRTQDISMGGMLFESSEPMSIGTIIKLELVVPNITKPARLLSRVVRIEEIREGEKYEIGVSFFELSEDQKILLKRIIE